jgi:hypothetical protein
MGERVVSAGAGGRALVAGAAALLCAAMLAGCAAPLVLQDEIVPEPPRPPAADRLPRHAGVYYSPQFLNERRSRPSASGEVQVPIGEASARLLDSAFAALFARATPVDGVSRDELSAKGVDFAIAPTLEHFEFRTEGDADSDRWSVAYRFTLYSTQGVPVHSWVVPGNGPGGDLKQAIRGDLEDAAERFVRSFAREAAPGLAAIDHAREPGAPALDPGVLDLSARLTELHGLSRPAAAVLQGAGVSVVLVAVRGPKGLPLVMRGSDVRLHLEDGRALEPTSMSAVVDGLTISAPDDARVFAAFIMFGLAGAMIAHNMLQNQRIDDPGTLQEPLFADRDLRSGDLEHGVVLFRLPAGASGLGAVTMSAWLVDPDSGAGARIEVPLSWAQQR